MCVRESVCVTLHTVSHTNRKESGQIWNQMPIVMSVRLSDARTDPDSIVYLD